MVTQSTQPKKTQRGSKVAGGAFPDSKERWHMFARFEPGVKVTGIISEFYLDIVGQWAPCYMEVMHNNMESKDKND